jgi:Arc/MetJ-type ribon-helix-helix transcriptional regulator
LQDAPMKTLQIQLPDQLAQKIAALIEAGWFASEEEFARLALSEFLRHHGFELQEQLQREDIEWALSIRPERLSSRSSPDKSRC